MKFRGFQKWELKHDAAKTRHAMSFSCPNYRLMWQKEKAHTERIRNGTRSILDLKKDPAPFQIFLEDNDDQREAVITFEMEDMQDLREWLDDYEEYTTEFSRRRLAQMGSKYT